MSKVVKVLLVMFEVIILEKKINMFNSIIFSFLLGFFGSFKGSNSIEGDLVFLEDSFEAVEAQRNLYWIVVCPSGLVNYMLEL